MYGTKKKPHGKKAIIKKTMFGRPKLGSGMAESAAKAIEKNKKAKQREIDKILKGI